MTTFSLSQQQLLKVLHITPVKVTDALSAAATSAQPSATNLSSTSVATPDLSQLLAQDITASLPASLNWQINSDAIQPTIVGQQLVTPALSTLQQAALKRTLWALLGNYDEN